MLRVVFQRGNPQLYEDCEPISWSGFIHWRRGSRIYKIQYVIFGASMGATLDLEGDLTELLQHEYDHLDGILATMRAIDKRSFFLKRSL